MRHFVLVCTALLLSAAPASADPPCGAVEFKFQPGAHGLQIAVWVEDANGKVVDTPYVTRSTGIFGIANRPGAALLKTDCGWPYGRREMVLPIWAHHRNHHYPKVVMGGACGNSTQSVCPDTGRACGGDCDDSTIAYHSLVSTAEPYFCAPEGCAPGTPPDVISCASMVRTLSKGAYLDKSMKLGYSLYPPRADLTNYNAHVDSTDVLDFPMENDLVAVSQATPKPGALISPPLYWNPKNLPPGDYVAWIELSQEADFNAAHQHPNQDDTQIMWNNQGHPFLGQPSVVYKVPFHYDQRGYSAVATHYAGYSYYDGSKGDLYPPDDTINDQPGSGAGRLVDASDGVDQHFRFKVTVGACQGGGDGGVPVCDVPKPVEAMSLTPAATSIDVSFNAPSTGEMPSRFIVRYRMGDTPITDADFDSAIVGPEVPLTAPGQPLKATIESLMPQTGYSVAVRGVAGCGSSSPVVSSTIKTGQLKYTTLSGCFIATAAYGTPLSARVEMLRGFRDRSLMGNALGRLGVRLYYSFSPPVAEAIAGDKRLRALVRTGLEPLVDLVERL